MSVATNSILKLLSDLSSAADKIVEENAPEFMSARVSKWICVIKNKADITIESESDTESAEIPSLMTFLKGTRERGPRASTVLTEIQRLHLHRKGKGSSWYIKTKKSRQSSVKTLLGRKSDLSIERKEETPPAKTVSPLNGKGSISKMDSRNSKRKSSSDLSLENPKKPKMFNIDQLNDHEDREKSVQKPREKEEKLTKAKNSSVLAIKSSVGKNVSVLKENQMLRSKIETKQDKAVENRKNIMALRQQKLDQNKRTREEKLEKTLQQRLKLEKEKLSRLRSGGVKTLTNSCKEATPKALNKTVAENETLGEISESSKKIKETSVKKLPMNLKKTASFLKSNQKTPVKKNEKHETEKILNSTYTATLSGEQPSTCSKGETLKEANIDSNSKTTKDISNDCRTQTTHTKSTKTVLKTVKPLIDQQKQLINSSKNIGIPAHTQKKKGPESYVMTPCRSSFVSYDISEIQSDSEEEEPVTNSKPIPSWATGVRLRNALLQQHHHPIDTDELFGNLFHLPDLAEIMGVKKKHYNKRTSSAVWNSSFS